MSLFRSTAKLTKGFSNARVARLRASPLLFGHDIGQITPLTAFERRFSGTSIDLNKPRLNAVIVGAGPSGFYTAKYLSSSFSKAIKADSGNDVSCKSPESFAYSGIDIDIVERLPTPYGLVRYGVAPDHPEVKNVENDFASVIEGHADGSDQNDDEHPQCTISYFGNVDVGHDISLQHLSSLYDIVVLAYGCQADKNLGIPGLDLQGVLSARQFVAWYNGHPEFGYVADIVNRCLWPNDNNDENEAVSKARVIVIGNGNVALDCARVLVKGKHGLESTDTPSSVLEMLRQGVKKVTVVGRRGHVQGAFTIKVSNYLSMHSLNKKSAD
jgi:adrenodoxin-NADP+ reductase